MTAAAVMDSLSSTKAGAEFAPALIGAFSALLRGRDQNQPLVATAK